MTNFPFGVGHDKVLLSNTKVDRVGLLLDNKRMLIGRKAEIIHFIRLMGVDGSNSRLRLGGIRIQVTLGVGRWGVYGVHLNSVITRLGGVSGSLQMDGGGENHLNRLEMGIGRDLVSSGGGL